MLPDRVSNPGPLTYESGALPIALRGPAAHKNCPRMPKQEQVLFDYIHTPSIASHFLKKLSVEKSRVAKTETK